MKKILGVVALSALVLSGCQSMTDNLASGFIEKAIENETGKKVDVSGITTGNIKIKTDEGEINLSGNADDGSYTITDDKGNSVVGSESGMTVNTDKGTVNVTNEGDKTTITNENGETVVISNDAVPAEVPAE